MTNQTGQPLSAEQLIRNRMSIDEFIFIALVRVWDEKWSRMCQNTIVDSGVWGPSVNNLQNAAHRIVFSQHFSPLSKNNRSSSMDAELILNFQIEFVYE